MAPTFAFVVARGAPAVWAVPGALSGHDCWAPVSWLTGTRTAPGRWQFRPALPLCEELRFFRPVPARPPCLLQPLGSGLWGGGAVTSCPRTCHAGSATPMLTVPYSVPIPHPRIPERLFPPVFPAEETLVNGL